MRLAGWLIVLGSLSVLTGCAGNSASVGTTALDAPPVTGSALSPLRGYGAMPVDIYRADALRAQGITTASGALQDIPQNDGR